MLNQKTHFTNIVDLKLRRKLLKCCIGAQWCMVIKTDWKYLESFETWCWKGKSKSVEPTVWKMRKCYVELRRKGTSYTQQNEGRLAELVTSCVGAPWSALLKERRKGLVDDEEDLCIYWMDWKNEKTLEFEGRRTISHCLKNSVWKRLWTCYRSGYKIMNVESQRTNGRNRWHEYKI